MRKLKIKGFRILIKQREVEEVSEGGIVISYGDKQNKRLEQHRIMEGTVLQVGALAFSDKGEAYCEVGDTVYYHQYAGKYVP